MVRETENGQNNYVRISVMQSIKSGKCFEKGVRQEGGTMTEGSIGKAGLPEKMSSTQWRKPGSKLHGQRVCLEQRVSDRDAFFPLIFVCTCLAHRRALKITTG